MARCWRFNLLMLLFSLVLANGARAGGLYLYEVGSPDVGLAAAGYAARAQDASTAFTNPAGMTRLDRPALLLGAQPMYLNLEFEPDENTSAVARTLPGGGTADDGDSNSWLPAGGLFYVHPVSDKLALGLAVIGSFGLSLDYDDDWVGRYYIREATLQAAAIQPAIAWKVNDWLSVGAGVAAIYGMLEEKMAVNNIDPSLPDGELELKDEDWSVQYNFGLLLEPKKGTRFGLTYLSEADIDFEDRVEFSGLGPGLQTILTNHGLIDAKLDLGVTLPQAVMFSAYHQLNDRLSIMGNLGWQDWSQFGKVDVAVSAEDATSLTADLGYEDTWHAALGAQYRLAEPWLLTGGVAYDSSMLDDEERSPAMPVGESWRFALGTRYDWSKDVTLGAAYELAWGGDLDLDVERGPLAGRVSGTYENAALHVVSLNVDWRF
ncbi:MAG TPA: outer membrane protein transport protein [Desulfuromonadales bacterium]